MTLDTAIAIARTLHAAFATDDGAAAVMVDRKEGLLPHEAEALRFLVAHPAYHAGRPALKASVEEAVDILHTVRRVAATA